jgi:hypothetical protein
VLVFYRTGELLEGNDDEADYENEGGLGEAEHNEFNDPEKEVLQSEDQDNDLARDGHWEGHYENSGAEDDQRAENYLGDITGYATVQESDAVGPYGTGEFDEDEGFRDKSDGDLDEGDEIEPGEGDDFGNDEYNEGNADKLGMDDQAASESGTDMNEQWNGESEGPVDFDEEYGEHVDEVNEFGDEGMDQDEENDMDDDQENKSNEQDELEYDEDNELDDDRDDGVDDEDGVDDGENLDEPDEDLDEDPDDEPDMASEDEPDEAYEDEPEEVSEDEPDEVSEDGPDDEPDNDYGDDDYGGDDYGGDDYGGDDYGDDDNGGDNYGGDDY